MKRNFLTGLVLLLPFVFTILLTGWILYLLSIPFFSLFHAYFQSLLISRFLSLILVLTLLIFIGYAAQYYIVKMALKAIHDLFIRVPLVRSIYHAAHETVKVLVRPDSRGFSEPVLVAYPSPSSQIVGFIPRRDFLISSDLNQDLIPVFIPGTVNPLMGFLIFAKNESVKPLNISSKEAFVWTISLAGNNPFIVNNL